MRRHGSESLWAQINRNKKPAKWIHIRREGANWTWREAAARSFSLRWVVARCMLQEGIGPRAAYRMVRHWTILNGHWPAPTRRPGKRGYAKRVRLQKARITSNTPLSVPTDEA